jgi:hypothetical protein
MPACVMVVIGMIGVIMCHENVLCVSHGVCVCVCEGVRMCVNK